MIFRGRALSEDEMTSFLSHLTNSIRAHAGGLDKNLRQGMRNGFRTSCNWDMLCSRFVDGMGPPNINAVQT